ncbi:MAG: hypothetical protein AAB653_01480 [Patescibacteria group bacterium]
MDEEIKKLLEKNIKLTEETHAMAKKIKGYLAFQHLLGIFYLIMIIAPIILGIIYLPPLLGDLIDQYKTVLDIDSGGKNNLLDKLDINNLLKK